MLIISLAWLLYTGVRNQALWRYRQNLINALYDARKADGYLIDGEWRREVMNRVSYNEMFWKFWRTFNSFYPDKSFTEPLPEHAKQAFRMLEETVHPARVVFGGGGGVLPNPSPRGSYSVSISAIRSSAK